MSEDTSTIRITGMCLDCKNNRHPDNIKNVFVDATGTQFICPCECHLTNTKRQESSKWLKEIGLESLKTELDDYHNHGFLQGLLATVEQVIDALEEMLNN